MIELPKVKVKLTKLQWQTLGELLLKTVQVAPVTDWEMESFIIADLYIKKMAFFSFVSHQKKDSLKLSLTIVQALAINNFFSANSRKYNLLLRIYIEPFLPTQKQTNTAELP